MLCAQTQPTGRDTFYVNKKLIGKPDGVDTAVHGFIEIPYTYTGICKTNQTGHFLLPYITSRAATQITDTSNSPSSPVVKARLLQVSGNVLYDVNYRSRIDTPYAERDVYQHTIQTRLDFVYKEQYPFRVYLTTRFSNSSFFRKYTDFNVAFNPNDFKRMMKARVMREIESAVASKMGKLDSLKKMIELKRGMITNLNYSLQKPDLTQQIVEEKERMLHHKPDNFPVSEESVSPAAPVKINMGRLRGYQPAIINSDSLSRLTESDEVSQNLASLTDSIESRKKIIDSLSAELDAAEKLYRKLKSEQDLNMAELRKAIDSITDVNEIVKRLKQLDITDSVLPKGYRLLSAVRSVSIGRSTADYSELSVRNISITGIQAEFNPRYYYAVAAGRVDYRFRDYIVPAHNRSRQYVALARFGKGTRDGNHIIFTYYTGKRQFFNSSTTTQPGSRIPEYGLAGITVEGLYRISRHIFFVGEIAKSTIPYYSLDSLQRKNRMRAVTSFNNRSNEAYAAKVQAYFPRTYTRFMANLRYTGANFQSFSTFTTGASQLRWKGRLEQPFFRKQLTIISSLEQNDYINPFVTTAYKTSAVMASIQANLRIKKWPVVSLGYYPSFQLVKTGDEQFSETRYYTLSGSIGYYYKVQNTGLSTYLLYSQFYNEASDSGFVYYNARNLLLSQHIMFDRLSLTINAALSTNTDYSIYTVEQNGQLTISKVVSAGAGVKLIRHSLTPGIQWGYSSNISLALPRLGELQLMIDKGFIPGMSRQLAENRMGRLTYYKTF